MTQEQKVTIEGVIKVLGNTEVKGKQNMLNLCGSIEYLEQLLRDDEKNNSEKTSAKTEDKAKDSK